MKRFLFSSLLVASLCGCAGLASRPQSGLIAQIDDAITGAPQTMAVVAEINGKPALLYANKDNRIAFQYGDQRRLLDEAARVHGGNRFQLHPMDQKLLAIWWSHEDGKNLYSTLSNNQGKDFGPVQMVNDVHGVLPPPSLLRGPEGALGVTYLDERQAGYQLYFNRSVDYGNTWAHPDVRLDTPPTGTAPSRVQEPHSVQLGSLWFTAWVDSSPSGYSIMARRSVDAGVTWSAPEVVYRPQKFVSSFTVQAQGEHIVLAADERARGIVAVASKDAGRSWVVSDFVVGSEHAPNADGTSNSGIEMALDGDLAQVVWLQDREGQKTQVMRASLDIAQAKWLSAGQRLDTKPHDNTDTAATTILVAPNGTIWTAWVDYRDIRPNIYVSYSGDRGKTWSAPEAFLQPGKVSAGLPRLMRWGDGVAIAYETYPTEDPLKGQWTLRTLALDASGKLQRTYAEQRPLSDAERTARLQQRVKTLWDQRLAGSYDTAYDVFDFAYRAAIPKQIYQQSAGTITYRSFSIEDIAVKGNEALVKMKASYEVLPTTLPSGKPLKLAPFDTELTNTWVWVGDEWYLVFAPSFGAPRLRY